MPGTFNLLILHHPGALSVVCMSNVQHQWRHVAPSAACSCWAAHTHRVSLSTGRFFLNELPQTAEGLRVSTRFVRQNPQVGVELSLHFFLIKVPDFAENR